MINQETLSKFEKLYHNSYNDILKYVVSKCSNMEDVKEIVQNIYLEVIKNIAKIECNNTKYIIGIAKHKIKDYYRVNYKAELISLFSNDEEKTDLIEAIPSDINLEESSLIKYDTELVWKYLKKKPVVIFKTFYLYYYLELTIKEISIELNITESNVKNYLYRTIKELHSYFESESDKGV